MPTIDEKREIIKKYKNYLTDQVKDNLIDEAEDNKINTLFQAMKAPIKAQLDLIVANLESQKTDLQNQIDTISSSIAGLRSDSLNLD